MKKILIWFLALAMMLSLAACTIPGGGGDNGDDDNTTYKVMVIEDEGMFIASKNPMTVKKGETATFDVIVDSYYLIHSVSGGTYDRATGKLTVENVQSDVRVEFELEQVDYDVTAASYAFTFNGDAADTCSVSGNRVLAGTRVTVKANDNDKNFLGWTIGSTIADGNDTVISTNREYAFYVTPDMADADGNIALYSNYAELSSYKYDANGGNINANTTNNTNTDYYKVSTSGSILTVTLKQGYTEATDCACLFWDDSTFTRDGYILIEYNTKADGTGEGYSLGSKYYVDPDDDTTLYCIWAKETDASLFETKTFSYAMPTNVNSTKAPHWVTEGIMITNYLGDEDTVVIPEKIGGKYVTGIGQDAFVNKNIKTLVMSKYMLRIADGAFKGCSKLETVYYPDGIYKLSDEWLDTASYTSLKNLYVNATMAPRHTTITEGAFAKKLMKLLSTEDENRIIVISGSSSFQGLSTSYLEALLNDYTVINFGTTRTVNGLVYLEAMSGYAHSGDVVIVAPENSIYMMGENTLYWKTMRELEGMNNLFRMIDISNYEDVFDAFAAFNETYKFTKAPLRYEQIVANTYCNEDGDAIDSQRSGYRSQLTKAYTACYTVTLNERVKSKDEANWRDPNPNYNDPANVEWCSFTDAKYVNAMNMAIRKVKDSGATVYFSFCPVDDYYDASGNVGLIPEAKTAQWLDAYEALILATYTELDGLVGSVENYIFNHEYFYDNAFHLNDYGRVYRTYQLYKDLAATLGISSVKGMFDEGTSFEGCLFETANGGVPKYPANLGN